jgi:hypothetical protein
MINQKNILAFVQYLYLQKYQTDAPQALLDKWAKLSDAEIKTNLAALFTSWQYSNAQAEQETNNWLQQQSKTTSKPNIEVVTSTSKWWRWPLLILIFAPITYFSIKYLQFSSLSKVYAITDNITVRDIAGKSIYRMDLIPSTTNTQPSSSFLTASDDVVYEKTLDSSGKVRQYRKVIYPEVSFMDYALGNSTEAYVNANLVTTNIKEYEKYKNVFKGLSHSEGKALELKYRKVIVGCLELMPQTQGLYAMTSCLNQKAGKGFSNFIMLELQKDAMYEVIARMSDGYYYKFTGNLRANSFVKPRRIGFIANASADDELMKGDYLFKQYAKDKTVKLFTCDGKTADYTSVADSYGGIDYFNYTPTVTEAPSTDFIDVIKDAGSDVIDQATDAMVDGIKDLINSK